MSHMKGGGAYNRFGVAQILAHTLTYPALRASVQRVAKACRVPVYNVADLGCSEGANSMPTVGVVLRELLAHGPPQANAVVFHEDLPNNDWNSLMATLNSEASYLHAEQGGKGEGQEEGGGGALGGRVFACAIGRSFYEPLFPSAHLHFACSYITLHWLSALPCALPGAFVNPAQHGVPLALAATWAAHAHADLVRFFSLRSRELVPGGELVVVMVGKDDDNTTPNPYVGGNNPCISRALAEMRDEGLITAEEFDAVAIPYFLRCPREVRAAVAELSDTLLLQDLQVHRFALASGNGGPDDARAVSDMFWAIHEPCIAAALRLRGAAERQTVMAALTSRFQRLFVDTHGHGGPLQIDVVAAVVARK